MAWIPQWWRKRPARPPLDPPRAALQSDPGCVRKLNEDSARIVEAGEVASQTAVETIELVYRRARGTPGQALAAAFRRAHAQILALARADHALAGMGTTCTALALADGQAWSAHVGDSRVYLIRAGAIYQLSEDQTQCREMVRRGLLSREEAACHADRNVLAHAMGTRSELYMELWPEPMPVQPGDTFLLCSDGLHDLVSADEIRDVTDSVEAPEAVCAQLVRMARERGGYDNVTVAVARVPAAGAAQPSIRVTREVEVKP
jgi:protein phosphatase